MVINRFSQWLQETDYFPDGVTSDMLQRLELRNAQAILARRSSKENLQPVSGRIGGFGARCFRPSASPTFLYAERNQCLNLVYVHV